MSIKSTVKHAQPERISIPGHHLVATAQIPEGGELRLVQKGREFSILLDSTELMATWASASEEALATMTCAKLQHVPAPDLLIGGYGMGYTLRAALAALGDAASVTLAELVPDIIAWARGPMHDLTASCLDDPRLVLIMDDVAMLIASAQSAYDAILLDVDNGPEGITRRVNDHLYTANGLGAVWAALKPGGILAVWSAFSDATFTDRLLAAGFQVEEVPVREHSDSREATHIIWFARRPEDR